MATASNITEEEKSVLLENLQKRFELNMHRHPQIKWRDVQDRLESKPEKLGSLFRMETTGGEPDVVQLEKTALEILFFDCSKESPKGRRSICYDKDAQVNRKKYPPKGNVQDTLKNIGIELLSENQYRQLQSLENFDTKTSSWIKTPESIRKLGGALFGDHRYGTVFIYHNGADSYYEARGFRGYLKV